MWRRSYLSTEQRLGKSKNQLKAENGRNLGRNFRLRKERNVYFSYKGDRGFRTVKNLLVSVPVVHSAK